ncbi:hypothetical protein [uncultured Cocleimonas sp.]|uniref:hypothetical protein n=1 Tax=uncultured Cocleimonas sp. TaxID=1051587 RepID=UPI002630F712|nr:hypothetical protein [uncultured Cocleimonas sp.]
MRQESLCRSLTSGQLLLCVFCFLLSVNAYSDSETYTVERESLNKELLMTQFNKKGVNAWGLNFKELQEYQRVIQGNRKFWSPNLHPLAALGMREGVTASERDALAEKLVHIERKRVDREIAFEEAFQAANRRLYSHVPLFKADPPYSNNSEGTPSLDSMYLNYYVRLPCPECKKPIQQWLKQDKQIDLYIASTSDKAIRSFAKEMGISPLLVPSKVRLNKTSAEALRKAGITQLPQVDVRR